MENLVGYAKRDLMVPQQPFDDLTTANAAAAGWCADVNAVAHSEICAVPAERLATELPLLGVLPTLGLELGAGRYHARSTGCRVSGSSRRVTRCRVDEP